MRYRIEFLWDPDAPSESRRAVVSIPAEAETRVRWMTLPAGAVPGSAFARPEEEGS